MQTNLQFRVTSSQAKVVLSAPGFIRGSYNRATGSSLLLITYIISVSGQSQRSLQKNGENLSKSFLSHISKPRVHCVSSLRVAFAISLGWKGSKSSVLKAFAHISFQNKVRYWLQFWIAFSISFENPTKWTEITARSKFIIWQQKMSNPFL